jgi:lysophospholipase L1-like esterase
MEPAPRDRNPRAPRSSRLRRAARLALRLVAVVAVVLVLGEIAVRLTGFVDRVNPFPRRLYESTGVADLPYRLRPGISLDVRGSRVDVNELGMRERPGIAVPADTGTMRILVLGDSVAFGWMQDVERAFPRQLEQRLNQGDTTGRRFEVLNAGVPGYNATAEAAWLREHGIALAPDTVVVAVNLNDFDRAPHLNALGILSTDDDRTSPLSPASWSELYLALRWGLLLARGDPRLALAGAGGAQPAAPPQPAAASADAPPSPAPAWDPFDRYVSALRKRFYRAPTEPQWSEMKAAWSDIARRAREADAGVVFAIFPDGDQIGVADPDLEPQRRLLGLCAELELECIDLTPVFAAAAVRSDERLNSDIMHPSDAGHAVAADAVADYLRR